MVVTFYCMLKMSDCLLDNFCSSKNGRKHFISIYLAKKKFFTNTLAMVSTCSALTLNNLPENY